jgi:hypothetical protein
VIWIEILIGANAYDGVRECARREQDIRAVLHHDAKRLINARATREASAIHGREQRFRLIGVPLATPSRLMTQDQLAGLARESACAFLFPPQMWLAVCLPTGIWTATQPIQYDLEFAQLDHERINLTSH